MLWAQVPNEAKGMTDLKTLSGGERSFVTICFLLALGKKLQVRGHAPALPPARLMLACPNPACGAACSSARKLA